MSIRLSYNIKNEKNEWGEIINIPSDYSRELYYDMNLKYNERTIIDKKELTRQINCIWLVIKDSENTIKDYKKEEELYLNLYTQSTNVESSKLALENFRTTQQLIKDLEEEVLNYKQIIVALTVLEQSEELIISYYVG